MARSQSSGGTKVPESSLTELCVGAILKLIRTGQVAVGSRLGEVALAKRLKMGRAPVRAALDRLASMGVVERIARSGTFVREFQITDYCEVIDVRAGLEGMAGYLATNRITDDELDHLNKVATELDRIDAKAMPEGMTRDAIYKHFDRIFALDFQFHMSIARICGNKRITALIEQQHLLERSFIIGIGFPVRTERALLVAPSHKDIVAALRKRNPSFVRDTIQTSLQGTKERVIRRFSGF